MRRSLVILLPLIALLVGGAGGRRTRQPRVAQPQMPTPHRTLQQLKNAVATKDRAGEWRTLSPGLKLRINRRAGRNIDVADYTLYRNSNARDPQIRRVESELRRARINYTRYHGAGRATVGIRFGGRLIGKTIGVQMVNHAFWQLRVRGERQPYWGFVGDKSIKAVKGEDGSYTVQTRNRAGKVTWSQTWPAKDVLSYRTLTKWYFDNFGAFENEFFGGVK